MAAAVVMMFSGSAIGASAGTVTEKNESFYGTYMRMLCTSYILNSTKRFCLAKTQVVNSSFSLIDGQTQSGALSKGGILTPNITVNNSNAVRATFYSEVRKNTSSTSSVIENSRKNIAF